MMPKITTAQIAGTMQLLGNLKSFSDKKYGSVYNLEVMLNPMMDNTILVKYRKTFTEAGQPAFENKLAAIDQSGKIEFIDERFNDAFQRAAFISDCEVFDITNPNSYEKTD